MSQTLIGRKIGMTQIYREDGRAVPVTLVESGPCVVTQVKREKADGASRPNGYNALQIGFGALKPFDARSTRRHGATKPQSGHAKKAGVTPPERTLEVPWDGQGEVKAGQQLTCKMFEGVKFVDVTGTSKGRGMAGVVKRYKFGGGPATHGQSDRQRAPGSIAGGNSDPSRVWKGKRMPGHMGAVRRTVRNLELVRIDADRSLLLIHGAVPGPNGGWLIVRKSKTKSNSAGSSAKTA